jgi:hypothetical protein
MVPMVQIREVRVAVTEPRVHVGMAMRLAGRSSRRVGVLVVLVVDVRVRVLERLVLVLVFVPLGEVKPHAGPHETPGEEGLPGQRLMERDGACDRSHEGRGREVRPRPSGAQETKGEDEQDETRAVSQEADDARAENGRGRRPGCLLDGQQDVGRAGCDTLEGGDLHVGGTDADLLEILGVVDHYSSLDLITTAMSDIRPPADH